MQTLMMILMVAAMVVSLICWIIILVKIFKENIGLGILGIICSLFAFIYGWVKVQEYQAKNIMLIWTIAWIVTIVAQALGAGEMFREAMSSMENGM